MMRIAGSHTYYNKQSASSDSKRAGASLSFQELERGATRWSWSQKDTLTLSDGAKVHIAENITGKEGVGDGNRYKKMVDFLHRALEETLGTDVENIDIGDLEVDKVKKTVSSKSATPREYNDMLSYRMTKSKATVELTHTVVEGTVKTSDGKELHFALDLQIMSEVGSSKQMTFRGTGEAAKDPPILMFDGVARELTSMQFRFDSNSDTYGPASGDGSFTLRDGSSEKAGSGFRRYQWYA